MLTTVPEDGVGAVPLHWSVSAQFSEVMDGATLTETSFTLVVQDTQEPVLGDVTYDASTAVFAPEQQLEPLTTFVATIEATAARDGNPAAAPQGPSPPPQFGAGVPVP